MDIYEDELAILEAEIGGATPHDPLDLIALAGEGESDRPDAEVIMALLYHPDSQQRALGASAFRDIQDPRAVPFLIGLLGDPCPLVRVNTAHALGHNTTPDAVEPLVAQFHREWNGFVRKGIVWALGNCNDGRAVPTLTEALKYDIGAVRLWSASALGQTAQIGYDAMIKAMPALVIGLRNDTISAVRSNCAWAIGQLCAELPSNVVYATAIDALIEAFAEDEEFGVKEDARSAILSVGDSRGLQVIEEIERDGYF